MTVWDTVSTKEAANFYVSADRYLRPLSTFLGGKKVSIWHTNSQGIDYLKDQPLKHKNSIQTVIKILTYATIILPLAAAFVKFLTQPHVLSGDSYQTLKPFLDSKSKPSLDDAETDSRFREILDESLYRRILMKALFGDAKAQYLLAVMYRDGLHVEQDTSQYFHWIKKSAQNGYVESDYKLAVCHFDGVGTAVDFQASEEWAIGPAKKGRKEAIVLLTRLYSPPILNKEKLFTQWAQKGAEMGIPLCQFAFGAHYLYVGKLHPSKIIKGIEWLEKAHKQGHLEATFALGKIYLQGIGDSIKADPKKGITFITAAANKGHAKAQYVLGERYFFGDGSPKDLKSALYWLEKSAKAKNPKAQFLLSCIYMTQIDNGAQGLKDGISLLVEAAVNDNGYAQFKLANLFKDGFDFEGYWLIEPNQKKAHYWLIAAAEHLPEAQLQVGLCYLKGSHGFKSKPKKAYTYLKKAADTGNSIAAYQLGLLVEQNKINPIPNPEEVAYDLFIAAADAGHTQAMKKLTIYDFEGTLSCGEQINQKGGFQWLLKAALQGDLEAMFKVGLCYEQGVGTEQNPTQAFEWVRKAAEADYPGADNMLAWFYYSGFGTYVDYEEMAKWAMKGIQSEGIESFFLLGIYYLEVKKNVKEAIKWLSISAHKNHPHSLVKLGYLYLDEEVPDGLDVPNTHIAFNYFTSASELGYPEGYVGLGDMYLNGKGVNKDPQTAFYYISIAAHKGSLLGYEKLGDCYLNGWGVVENLSQALEYYHYAANNGLKSTQWKLYHLYKEGEKVPGNLKEALKWLVNLSSCGDLKAAEILDQMADLKLDLGEEVSVECEGV